MEKWLSSIPPLNWNQAGTEACLNNSSQSLFSLKPVSAAFVHCQLRLLNTSTGTGLDGIPARLLKDAAPSISAPLTAIINLSISSAVLPEEWKKAKVVPLYKDGDKKCMDNYHPISVLLVASKIQISPVSYLPSSVVFEKIIPPRTPLHISRIVLGKALTNVVLQQQCLSTFEKPSTV